MSIALSVIVPAYNAEQYLKRCVESIVTGRYQDLEVLLIDDGSTDGTAALCDQLQQKHRNIQVFHTPNRGLPRARNLGIDHARGRYIGFVDADDVVTADMFERLVGAMEADVQLTACLHCRCSRADAHMKMCTAPAVTVCSRSEIAERMVCGNLGPYVWNKLYRLDILNTFCIRFPSDSQGCEDLYFNVDYLLHCEKAVCIEHPMYFYIATDGSIMDTFRKSRFVDSQYMSLPRANRYAAEQLKGISPRLEGWTKAHAVMFYQTVLRKLDKMDDAFLAEAIIYISKNRSVLRRYIWGWKYYLSAVLLSASYPLWAMIVREKR